MLHRADHIMPHPRGSTIYRSSRLILTIAAIVILAIGIVYAWWAFNGAPWPFKIGAVVYWLIFPPLTLAACLRSYSPHNWLMRIDHDGVAIRFRSHLRGRAPDDRPEAVLLKWRDIADAHALIETVREGRRSERHAVWKRRSIILRLTLDEPEAIGLAIIEDAALPRESVRFGIRTRGGFVHHPVRWRDDENAIQIDLRSRNDHVRPGLTHALDLIGRHVPIEPTIHIDAGQPGEMSDAEFEAHLLGLVDGGSRIAAIKALRERTGCTLTEAKQTLDRLTPTL